MQPPSSPLLCLLLVLSAAAGAQAAETTVSAGYDAAQALVNQDVTKIGIKKSINLEDFSAQMNALTSNGAQPYLISRSLTIYNAGAGTPTVDLAFFPGLATIAPGVTVTFRGIRLRRAAGNLPTALFRNSPGAFVVLDSCEINVLACAPNLFSQQFFTTFMTRPGGGQNQATFTPGSSTIQLVDVSSIPPATPPDLGGYTITYTNTKFTCDNELPLSAVSSSCPELTTNPPSNLTRPCVQATVQALYQAQCPNPKCINFCRAGCSRRRRSLSAM